jgi:hypothetical protein
MTARRYHLVHCIPNPRMHGFYGYNEVIETVMWGLEQLGHQATYAVNKSADDAINIMFGAQILPINVLTSFPKDTIIYNFEQIRGLTPDLIRPEVKYYAEHFEIWDYSRGNLPTWSALGRDDVRIVPVGYAPFLTRIPKAPQQDIDVLIYGLTSQLRLEAFHQLSQRGLSALFACGLYGQARDGLISRAKIVLNINLYQFAKIFEIVRASYLLANKKAVVADLDPDTFIEDDIRSCIKFTSLHDLADVCLHLAENEDERVKLEESGFSAIAQRDIRTILTNVL